MEKQNGRQPDVPVGGDGCPAERRLDDSERLAFFRGECAAIRISGPQPPLDFLLKLPYRRPSFFAASPSIAGVRGWKCSAVH